MFFAIFVSFDQILKSLTNSDKRLLNRTQSINNNQLSKPVTIHKVNDWIKLTIQKLVY